MPFTTGIITNTRDFGTAASNIVVSIHNTDSANSATVLVQIIASVTSETFYTAYVMGIPLPPSGFTVREFFIAGNVAYEVQLDVTAPTPSNVILSTYGIDRFGNLVAGQRVLQSELTTIPAISTLP
ncbi:MAG: hypothetical protein K0R57_1640 [Paenibacillaceae bacterium]|jgi:hypothetical protein|nr:hypothetical protein [Paenibacillaceae bacterium]